MAFVGAGDACPACAALNGKIFDANSPEASLYTPPLHINCRCYWSAVDDDEVGAEDRFDPNDRELVALIEEHAHFVTNPDAYVELRVPAPPAGPDFTFRRGKAGERGTIEYHRPTHHPPGLDPGVREKGVLERGKGWSAVGEPDHAMSSPLPGDHAWWRRREVDSELVSAVQDEAKRLGVTADYADDLVLGIRANAVFREAIEAGWRLPDEFVINVDRAQAIKAEQAAAGEGRDWMATTRRYLDGRIVVVVDPSHQDWEDASLSAKLYGTTREWSTISAEHVLRHELAHGASQAVQRRALTEAETAIAERVSRVATVNSSEFVGEVGARLLGGYTVDRETLDLYERLGGAVVRQV